jgi:hypothetical protein
MTTAQAARYCGFKQRLRFRKALREGPQTANGHPAVARAPGIRARRSTTSGGASSSAARSSSTTPRASAAPAAACTSPTSRPTSAAVDEARGLEQALVSPRPNARESPFRQLAPLRLPPECPVFTATTGPMERRPEGVRRGTCRPLCPTRRRTGVRKERRSER